MHALRCAPVQCTSDMANEMTQLNASGLVDPVACGATAYGSECNASCTLGHVPKDVPFRCDVTSGNVGVWFGDIECERFDCGEVAAFPFDPKATVVLSLNCTGANLSWDPRTQQCSDDTVWHPTSPPHRALRDGPPEPRAGALPSEANRRLGAASCIGGRLRRGRAPLGVEDAAGARRRRMSLRRAARAGSARAWCDTADRLRRRRTLGR